MAKVALLDKEGKKVKDITLSKEIFDIEVNKTVLHEAIVLTQASLRQGTHKVKNRAEVRGGGRKPWRQKGTGRARHGSIRSNIWVGGGVVFGPTPMKNYTKEMNKKERTLALLSALSVKAKDLVVVEEMKFKTPKTKEFIKFLENLKLENTKTLVITDELDENIILASRNLKNINLIETSEINVLDLINADKVLITEKALKELEEAFK